MPIRTDDKVQLPTLQFPLYGANQFTFDLGANVSEIAVQAALNSNTGFEVGHLVNDIPATGIAQDLAASHIHGVAFGNQATSLNAANVQIVSDGADTRTVTIYGTVTGTNIVQKVTGTLNGAVAVNVAATLGNWGFILGVVASAASATRTITVQTIAAAAITTIATTATTSGVTAVAAAYQNYNHGLPITAVAGAASTKVVGVVGEDGVGTEIYAAIPLNGTTRAAILRGFWKPTYFLTGDAAAATEVTFEVGQMTMGAGDHWITHFGARDDGRGRAIQGRYLHACVYNGTSLGTTGVLDFLNVQRWR